MKLILLLATFSVCLFAQPAVPFPTMRTAPSTCSVGQFYLDTSGITPALKQCNGANTWVSVGFTNGTPPGGAGAACSSGTPYLTAAGSIYTCVGSVWTVAGTGSSSTSSLGLNNALSYACGISINDGGSHTIGSAPSGSCFNGLTTLAGLAAIQINGATPFSFLTDSGTITGPLCTNASSTNCFTSGGGLYALTNASVSGMQIGWLALQACFLTRQCYAPAGPSGVEGYVTNYPLMIPINIEGTGTPQPHATFAGDGINTTLIQAASDFGANSALMSCGDPAGTPSNHLGRYGDNAGQCSGDLMNMVLASSASPNFFPVGNVTTILMDGLFYGARLRMTNIEVDGFLHDLNIVGDHASHYNVRTNGGSYGMYYAPPNPSLYAGQTFFGLQLEGPSMAAVLVDGATSDSSDYEGQTYFNASPYGWLGASNGCSPILSGTIVVSLITEFIGNAQIADDHNFSGGTYTDANKCRDVTKAHFGALANSWINAEFLGGGRGRRATWDINQGDWTIDSLQIDGVQFTPNAIAAPSGPSPIAVWNVKNTPSTLGNIRINGNMNGLISQAGSLPLFSGVGLTGDVVLSGDDWSGTIGYVNSVGTYTATTVEDCLESHGTNTTNDPCGTGNSNIPGITGVVVQGGVALPGYVPFATSGAVYANMYWNAFTGTAISRATGIRGLTLAAGTGYTNGTYTATATGGGCSIEPVVSLVVASGGLSSYTLTNPGKGCTSAPAVAIPGGAGSGSGGTITAQWPSGLFASAVNYQDAPFAGVSQGSFGSPTTGNQQAYLLIQLGVSTSFGTVPPQQTTIPNCMFDYWFNEGTGTSVVDHCSTNNATFPGSNAPSWSAAGIQPGLVFAGNQNLPLPAGVVWSSVKTLIIAYKPNVYLYNQTSFNAGGGQFNVIASAASGKYVGLPWFNPIIGSVAAQSTAGTIKAYGNTVTAWVLASPTVIYQNGTVVPGYMVQSTDTFSGSTGALGDWLAASNQGYGFPGEILWATGYSTVLNSTQIQQEYQRVQAALQARATPVGFQSRAGNRWVSSGDSITCSIGADGDGIGIYYRSYQDYALRLVPFQIDWSQNCLSGQTLTNLINTDKTTIDAIASATDYNSGKFVASIFAGTNDLQGGATAAAVYANTQTWVNNRVTAGDVPLVFETLPRNVVTDSIRVTLNGDIEAGFIAGTLSSTNPQPAIVPIGNDPNMGQSGQYATTWYEGDNTHPSASGNSIIGAYTAPALMRSYGQGYWPVCSTVDVSNNAGTWALSFNGQTAGPGATVTAGTTQSVPLFYIGPKYKITSTEVKTLTAFSGTTTLVSTLGDSVGGATFYDSTSYNLNAAVSNSNFHDAAPNTSDTWSGSNLILALTSTVNNLTSISAGKVRVTFCVASIP